ncbi:hypothetical protein BGX38DRAFT_1265481 [Terfezia claveryi]|nr:hypothetical protein BGX38DRAFT_1265481 [Terfezia claveryi]
MSSIFNYYLDLNGSVGKETQANKIFAILEAEYSSVLATKFIDELVADVLKLVIDSHFEADYTFPEVVRVYAKTTGFDRRKEKADQQQEKKEEVVKTEMELMMETINRVPRS